ncbi:related to UBX domain-containing protein 1 [Zygosaccharomyces bailii ISA1307]|nr:related to UBX domain-containing protein 1 [Zygosaccharomyces bailii ISA1307]
MSGVPDENIQQFMALANCSFNTAQQYLQEFGDIGEALNAYYAAGTETKGGKKAEASGMSGHPPNYDSSSIAPNSEKQSIGSSRPTSANTARGGSSRGSKPKFMTFSDMVKDRADDEDEDDPNRNTFAGGETSGLEVADPNDSNSLIRDLLEKAKRGGQQVEQDSDVEQPKLHSKQFSGKGYRLGSMVDTPNQVVEDIPQEPLPEKPKKVTREITFWKEGFQVGDGPLYRYDDPANSFYLNELNQGRAPLKLLDVEFGQEVDVNVYKKLDESYQPPKRKLGGFQGQGQRLGSPVPGESRGASLEPSTEPAEDEPAKKEEDEDQMPSKGDSSVQIRYANGKREVLRCNSTDTVQSLYDHVKSNTTDSRAFTLNHAFPVKPLEDYDSTLKDAGLVNAVVVQRWV